MLSLLTIYQKMKIFIDVGSHYGETLNEIKKLEYGFDRIFCIEPSKKCIQILKKYNDKRIKIINAAFGNCNKVGKLYSSGDLGASIFTNNPNLSFEKINIISASQWFNENVKEGDVVFVKLNCEGAECDIIDDLINSDEIKKIYSLLVTFDVRDFMDLKHREIQTRKRLLETKLFNYCFSDDVMIGDTHENRIRFWLQLFGAKNKTDLSLFKNEYKNIQKYYSNKTGFFYRLESNIKSLFNYNSFPEKIKKIFRFLKKMYFKIILNNKKYKNFN